MTKVAKCPECGADMGQFDQTCQKCGKALSYEAGEGHVGCAVCSADIGAYIETCPECGETELPGAEASEGAQVQGLTTSRGQALRRGVAAPKA